MKSFDKFMKQVLVAVTVFCLAANAFGKLTIKLNQPQQAAGKTLVKLTLRNTFTNKVESARATLFLLNDDEKVVGQSSQWVVGGTKDKPALAPGASATYNFVVPTDKPFTKAKLIFNRIILEGGRQVDPANNFEIEKN
jgi:hypothetical protein